MNDEKKDFEWNPPTPPWQSEPEPLRLRDIPGKDPEPVESTGTFVDGPNEEIPVIPEDGAEPSTETEVEEPSGDIPTLLFNGKPVNEEFREESEDEDGTELDGFFFYRIKASTGITLNGKHYVKGAYWFNEETFDTMTTLDAP